MTQTYSIPGVYRRPRTRAEGFPRVRTDVAGFVGVAGPRHLGKAVAVDDWKGFVAQFHGGDEAPTKGVLAFAPAGAMLHAAVRSFFANGGRRAVIVNVAPGIDADRRQELLNTTLGLGESLEPHGLELLLRQDEVSILALPDLDAQEAIREDRFDTEPPGGSPCFVPCMRRRAPGVGPAQARVDSEVISFGRLYSDDDLLWAQRYVIQRLQQVRWRWFAVLAPPPGLTVDGAVRWRQRLTRGTEDIADVAALYWPWVLQQRIPGAPNELRSPVGAVAGIFAAVDIERGPHAAPANRRIDDAVGLQEPAVDDEAHRTAYDAGVNVLRAAPGQGVQLVGARTLLWTGPDSGGDALAWVNARRCLSAIARTVEAVGRPLVFEPNNAMLRIRLHQLVTDYLLRVFATGALMGDAPEQGFFVSVVPFGESAEAELVCEVGVALAAPAEFIVFRIGREGAVIERGEAA